MAWSEAILVGGGPSLTGFDWERLRGRTLVAINDAMVHLPWATAMFSADSTWAENRRKEMTAFAGEKYLAIARPLYDPPIPGMTYLVRGRTPGLSFNSHTVNIHGSSGFGALNLAVLHGAKTIFLLGFDYRSHGYHWYENYPWQPPSLPADNGIFEQWADYFDLAAEQLKKAGVEVYNACPESLIKSFPTVTLEEVVEWHTRTQATLPVAPEITSAS